MDKEKLLQAFSDFLEGVTGGTNETPEPTVEVVKSLDEEQKLATFVVLAAMEDETEFDLHGDTYTAEEVQKACHDFNQNCMKANLGHLVMIDEGTACVVESYTTPVAFEMNDQIVPAGSWLQTWKFADDSLWQGVKDGDWNGLSVQCMALPEEIK